MHIFYTPDISGIEYTLNEEESKHAVRVLRMSLNEEIIMLDGRGTLYKAVIADPNPKRCKVIVTDAIKNYEQRNYKLHIAISPLKNPERLEWFLEKATEIGIDEITPIICERTEKKNINLERCNRIVESAMKQSVNAFHPIIKNTVKFRDFMSSVKCDTRLMATCDGERSLIISNYKAGSEVVILIGPEGDFTNQEINNAKTNNFKAVTLGPSRLRTETAGIVACNYINFINLVDFSNNKYL